MTGRRLRGHTKGMRLLVVLLVSILSLPAVGAPVSAEPGRMCSSGSYGRVMCIRPAHFVFDTCQAIEHFAETNGLAPGFFARLIWQESRFDPNALSPADARGIAQFIDSTAEMRGLVDSYNPALALEYSARYLGEMSRAYGNPGLAAVGYNGGEARAEGLIAQTGGLARETVQYVRIITGLTAETWRDDPPEDHDWRLQGDMPFADACHDLARNRRMTRYPPPEPDHAPFGVQLAYGLSPDAARAAFAERSRACRSGVEGVPLDIVFVRNRVSGRKGYYMARLGRDTAQSAHQLCNALRRQGCVCAVYPNG
ncbi:Membrane-bound lytic murein transglycosylase F [Roseivivax jejudonensis]|uniref:Membrane-bound lytic murein transglycosylase F n=1 Tax=Roseivivax jejudonensis TaxID=1529041 RepID=A0A1X6ZDA5_9RHOB|nr:lytic transglycosylase domain-containing protein [Roseivivax jejudonensis]SLN47599.1 Membrane-bound lytic murein transglycosylase F [Roseivivax jejudonensis]